MWYRDLVAAVGLAVLAWPTAAAADTYAADTWDFSEVEEFTVPAAVSAVPRWVTIPYEGTLLWDGCELFLAEHPDALSGVTIPGCVGTIAEISGLRNPDRVPAGAMVMVPSPTNTSAEIATQRSQRTDIQSLAANPLGMAEALLMFNRDIDEYNERLEDAEERLDEHDGALTNLDDRLGDLEVRVTTLAESAGADLSAAEMRSIAVAVLEDAAIEPGMTEFEVQARIQAALDEQRTEFEQQLNSHDDRLVELETQVAALSETMRADLSEAEVRSIAASVLEEAAIEPGMTESDVQARIQAALDEQAVEFEQLAADMAALRQELESLRSAQMSPEDYARTALEIARDLGVSEAQVESVVADALTDLDLVSSADMSAAIESAVVEVQSQVSDLETQVSTLQEELRTLRSESSMSPQAYAEAAIQIARDLGMSEADVDEAVQTALADLDLMAPDDVSAAIEAALDERDFVSQADLDTALQDAAADASEAMPAWVPWLSGGALGLGIFTLLLLWWKSRRDKRRSQDLSNGLDAAKSAAAEATKTAESAKTEAGAATTEAGKAQTLAVKAMTTAKVGVDLHLKADQRLKGDLPSPEELNELNGGESVDVTVRKDDGSDVVVRFTRVTNLLDDGKGNRFDGFKVAGIRNLKQGVKMHPSNMVRIIANANKNNTLEGVPKTSTST